MIILRIALFIIAILQIPGFAQERAQQWKDIPYVNDTLVGHRMDIYLPENGEEPFPVAVVIYGSAWFGNDRKERSYELFGPSLLSAGFAVAAINHRSSREAIFPAQVHDVKAVVRFLRGNAADYSLDTSFIAAVGNSSGGHLAAFLGTSVGIIQHSVGNETALIEGSLGNYTEMSSKVDAVVDWYGPTNFLLMDSCGSQMDHNAADSPESTLVGGSIQENKNRCALANPTTYVDTDDPPFLILHGTADPLVPPCQSEILHQALRKHNVNSELIIVEGAKHGPGLHEPKYFKKMTDFLLEAREVKQNEK
ncbi:MAG: alpha/beta hydrolase [Bacteroidota bacterium]